MKLLRAGKRAVQSHIVSHVKDKLRKRTKRSCNNSIESGKPRRGGGGGVLWISSDRDARRIFLGLKVWISGRKILASTFLGSLI